MALRDQPYLPLYVQDFLTDEKLAECSAESTGVYIRLMCIMHKSKEYGKILLRQNERQSERLVPDFAEKLSMHMPYKVPVIERALDELLDKEVLYIEENALCQKRMIKDAELSEKRAFAGKKGAETSNKRFSKNTRFAAAKQTANKTPKQTANTEIEIEYEIEGENKNIKDNNKGLDNPFHGELHDAFQDWLAYKKEKNQSYKPQGLKSLITQVTKYAEQFGETETAEAIRDSMASNYQGIVFEKISRAKSATKKEDRLKTKTANEYKGKDFFDE